MAHPWLEIKANFGYFMEHLPEPGDFMEMQLYDDEGAEQGTGIAHVLQQDAYQHGVALVLHLVVVSDQYYHHYLFEDGGGDANPAWFWFGPKQPPKNQVHKGERPIYCDSYRELLPAELVKDHVEWVGPVCQRKVGQYLRSIEKGVQGLGAGAAVRAASRPILFGEVGPQDQALEYKDADLVAKKTELRRQMDDLEAELDKCASEDRKRVTIRSREDVVRGPFKGVKETSTATPNPSGERRDRRSRSVRGRANESSGKCAKKTDDHGGKRGSSLESASPSPWRVAEYAQRIRDKRTLSPTQEDQVFQLVSRSTNYNGRAKLVNFAEKHPRQLASSMLKRMQARVMDEGEATSSNTTGTPIVGKLYYNKVLKNKLVNKRNAQEVKTLLTVMDHLSAQRYNQAADVLAQRVKAIELAQESGAWETAKFLELVEDDGDPLADRDEQAMILQQMRFENSIKVPDPSSGKGQHAKGDHNQWFKGKCGKITKPTQPLPIKQAKARRATAERTTG